MALSILPVDVLFKSRALNSAWSLNAERRTNYLGNGFICCYGCPRLGFVCDKFYFDWLAPLDSQYLQFKFIVRVDHFPV